MGSLQKDIPNGQYSFPIKKTDVNTGYMINAAQTIAIDAQFNNYAHRSIGSNGRVVVAMDKTTVFICAHSAEEARQIALDNYGFFTLPKTIAIQIENPIQGSVIGLDSNGAIDIKAYIDDELADYVNLYSVTADIAYIGQQDIPVEHILLFDDGKSEHADATPNDRYFNAEWKPKYSGAARSL